MAKATYIHGTDTSEQERLAALNAANNAVFLRFLEESLRGREPQRVLEVGSGLGILTCEIARRWPGAEVVGIEHSPEQLARVPSGAAKPENVRFVQGDAHHLPFEDRAFDVVCCRFVLEHVGDPPGVLREMSRLLAAGGGRGVGVCCVQENNILINDFDPDCPKWDAVWAKFAELQQRLGGDALMGKRLFRLMKGAGFRDITLSIQPELHHAGQESFPWWVRNLIGNVRSGERAMIEHGLATRQEIEDAVGELEALIKRDDATALFYWNRACASA